MCQMKRQLSYEQPSHGKGKRTRSRFYEENSSITCLETVSNELFYEIWDYLDGYDICKAFSNLNIRFENLLVDLPIRLKIRASINGQSTIEQYRRDFIISNNHRLFALDFIGSLFIGEIFLDINVSSSFNRLESVMLRQIRQSNLLKTLDVLKSLPRLSSLDIRLKNHSRYLLSDIYPTLFQLPTLKCIRISLSHRNKSNSWAPLIASPTPNNITRMVLNHYCTFHDLISILRNTRSLSHLTCHRLAARKAFTVQKSSIRLSSLTHLTFRNLRAKFHELETFFETVICQLQRFHVTTHSDLSYLNGDRWKELIQKHMPHLYQFHFNYRVPFHRDIPLVIDHEAINQFTSSFWIERLWDLKIRSVAGELIYSVCPHRDMWFRGYIYDRIILSERTKGTFQKEFISPIQLIFHRCSFGEQNEEFGDQLKPHFHIVEFTHLDIRCDTLSIWMLIKILNVLPQVDSLELSSSLLVGATWLSTEEQERLSMLSTGKTITTVKLSEVNEIDQVRFLMDICPRMEHLMIEGSIGKNKLRNLIEVISLNKATNSGFLQCLWIGVQNANNYLVQFIEDVVDFERFFNGNQVFRDYVIEQLGDEIYLKWKA